MSETPTLSTSPVSTETLYPLRFEPTLKHAIWGGRKIETLLGKPLPPGDDYAESWEITDHRLGVSKILYGRFAGETLHFLVENYPEALMGVHKHFDRFPLLLKILDANHQLSVQVHPDDDLANALCLSDGGKDEAWVVLESEPDSFIFTGFRFPVTEKIIRQAIEEGALETLLYRFHPEVGQSLYLPAGTVHSLGAGVLIAEIQQSSDHTFRLYDWNRLDKTGKTRELHIEEGIRALTWDQGKILPQKELFLGDNSHETLVSCDKFITNRYRFNRPLTIGGQNRAHIIFVVQGEIEIENDPAGIPLRRGYSVLLPAAVGAVRITPLNSESVVILDYYMP